jgi:hypothetical protein
MDCVWMAMKNATMMDGLCVDGKHFFIGYQFTHNPSITISKLCGFNFDTLFQI